MAPALPFFRVPTARGVHMLDLVLLGLAVALFGLTLAFIWLCERVW